MSLRSVVKRWKSEGRGLINKKRQGKSSVKKQETHIHSFIHSYAKINCVWPCCGDARKTNEGKKEARMVVTPCGPRLAAIPSFLWLPRFSFMSSYEQEVRLPPQLHRGN